MKELLSKFNFLGDARVKKAEFNESKDSLQVSLLVKNKLSDTEKSKVKAFLKTEMNVKTVDLLVSYGLVDERAILNVVNNLLKTRFVACFSFVKDISINVINKREPAVDFKFKTDGRTLLESSGFEKELRKELALNFFEEFTFSFEFVNEKLDVNAVEELKQNWMKKWEEDEPKVKWIYVTGPVPLLGELVLNKARRICDLNAGSGEVVICGMIKFFNERTFKKLNKKTKEEEDRTFFPFKVYDGTESLNCSLFCSKTNIKKVKKLSDGSKVLMIGSVDLYNERLSFKPREISFIESFKEIKTEEVKKVYKGESEHYKLIKPTKYEEYTAVDFEYKEEVISEKLKGRTFVVFDVETTGKNPDSAEIVELAGVKVVDGIITEKFSTLIKPVKYAITPENEAIHHISPAMVENAPTFKQIVSDFYKWASGTTLVGQFVQFDLGFLNNQANEQGYHFDHGRIDTIDLAKAGLGGRLSNNKLSSICAALGIVNDTAHRALSDAVATAKVLIKLGNYIEPIKVAE